MHSRLQLGPKTSIIELHSIQLLNLIVSEDFVKAQLRGLKTGKAMGLDNIPARLLIDSADIVAKPLAEMINFSLKSGRVPLDFKSTRVILLFKKGKVVEMDNYGPISILPTV